jgi:hypothetical protein
MYVRGQVAPSVIKLTTNLPGLPYGIAMSLKHANLHLKIAGDHLILEF